jgi:hypothetical protein
LSWQKDWASQQIEAVERPSEDAKRMMGKADKEAQTV